MTSDSPSAGLRRVPAIALLVLTVAACDAASRHDTIAACHRLDAALRKAREDSAAQLAGVDLDPTRISLATLRKMFGNEGSEVGSSADNEVVIGWLLGPADSSGTWADVAIRMCAQDGPDKAHRLLVHDPVLAAHFLGDMASLTPNSTPFSVEVYEPFRGTIWGVRLGDSVAKMAQVATRYGTSLTPGIGEGGFDISSTWRVSWSQRNARLVSVTVRDKNVVVLPK